MNKVLLIAALFLCFNADAQKTKKPTKKKKTPVAKTSLKVAKVDVKSLPKDITYSGKIRNAVRWTDKQGEHIVVTAETGKYLSKKSENGEGMDADLSAQHFILKPGRSERTWVVNDRIKDCPLDIQVAFIKNSFQVTDLDKNGVAEVWVMYKTACHGDLSPCDMKIIMYEGNQKYAMRGQNKVVYNETHESVGGEYKADEAFTRGPKAFLDFAKKLWERNIMEEWYNG